MSFTVPSITSYLPAAALMVSTGHYIDIGDDIGLKTILMQDRYVRAYCCGVFACVSDSLVFNASAFEVQYVGEGIIQEGTTALSLFVAVLAISGVVEVRVVLRRAATTITTTVVTTTNIFSRFEVAVTGVTSGAWSFEVAVKGDGQLYHVNLTEVALTSL